MHVLTAKSAVSARLLSPGAATGQVLEGGSDAARLDRMRMAEALELCLKSIADRRREMMMDDVGHGDIESWISKLPPLPSPPRLHPPPPVCRTLKAYFLQGISACGPLSEPSDV